MKRQFIVTVALAALVFTVARCNSKNSDDSKSSPSMGQGFSYSSTTNKGDYAEWTFSGSQLTAKWQMIDSSGSIKAKINLTADCGTYHSDFNYYTCAVANTSTCEDVLPSSCGGWTPPASIEMMEVPGVAMIVHDNSQSGDQLHIGMLKDANACNTNVSGDYVFTNTGLGRKELFGVYRSDANFESITHSDFGMNAASDTATPAVKYMTSDTNGVLTFDAFANATTKDCESGVRSRSITTPNGTLSIRSMITQAGVFILDLPAGMGGMVAIKKEMAATIGDFAGKEFAGLTFPDQGESIPIKLTAGALAGGVVPVSGEMAGGQVLSGLSIDPLSATSVATAPAFPDFAATPTDGDESYANNNLHTPYPNLKSIDGLFKLDGTQGDTARIMVVAGKFNGKVVAFGAVYNWRRTSDTNPSTGSHFDEDHLYNTGNFILFER